MGSYYDLRVEGYSVLSGKWRIEEEVLSLFVEADKVRSQTAPDLPSDCANVHEEEEFFGYCSAVAAISDRLDVMGFTPDLSKAGFSLLLHGEIEEKLREAQERSSRKAEGELYLRLDTDANREISLLSELSFEKWVDAIPYGPETGSA